MSTRKERLYLVQALRAYSVTTPGQFDRDTVTRPQITQDAADEITWAVRWVFHHASGKGQAKA